MGQKKDTLLRWVNCCSDNPTPIERLKNLSDGYFFVHILNFLRTNISDESDPWVQTVNILRDYKVQENVVDYDSAASGNEDELAKLIVICMHLTMVQKPCEGIKEKTMWNLSTEDQKVIESILLVIVNDDQLTRSRLNEVLQDLQENNLSKPVIFYTSSPLSSMAKNSPLKRFLDSPMALRLTRLQKEISDKNEEIRRLQAELLTESDETSTLSSRMEDLKRKVKDLEKKNTELEQRLRDCQIPDSSGPECDIEIIQLKKQLKKLQNEYESSCQKYCDLNIEYEALKTRQDKDRKQIRQLQLDLNETVVRFERESAEYQLLLDSIRTENVELKHALEEKTQWIDVLEEKNRSCSELHTRFNAPRSPCERESIGFSLLSMEAEKLQDELETYRRNLTCQTEQFDSEKRLLQQRTATLEEEKRGLHRLVDDANHTNRSLQGQLDQTKNNLEQLASNCDALSKEKEELRHSFDSLQSEFDREMERARHQLDIRNQEAKAMGMHIESLNQQLEEIQSSRNAFEQSARELSQQKVELSRALDELQRNHIDLQSTLSNNQSKFQCERDELVNQLESNRQQIAGQLGTINGLKKDLDELRHALTVSEERAAQLLIEKDQLVSDKGDLEQQISSLTSDVETSKQEFQSRFDRISVELQTATAQIAVFCETSSSLKSQLEVAFQERQALEILSAQLESDRNRLSVERDELQVQVQQLTESAQLSRIEFQSEKENLLKQLETRSHEVTEQAAQLVSTEAKYQAARQQVIQLESSIRCLQDDATALVASRTSLEQQVSALQLAVDTSKVELRAALDRAEEDAENRQKMINQHQDMIQSMQVHLDRLSEEKQALESKTVELGEDSVNLRQQLTSLEQMSRQERESHDVLVAEMESLKESSRIGHETQQQQIASKMEEIAGLEQKLESALAQQDQLECLVNQLSDDKSRFAQENDLLKGEVATLALTLSKEQAGFEVDLTRLRRELQSNQEHMTESKREIQQLQDQLTGMMAEKSSLENRIEKMSAEYDQMIVQRSSLEEENVRNSDIHRQQVEEYDRRLSQLTEEHGERVNQLNERIESAQQLNDKLREDCERLEKERETLHFEKCGFEQMYLEVKAMCEEAEVKSQVDSEMSRRESETKEQKLIQLSATLEELERVVGALRLEKEAAESNYARQVQLLESEKQKLVSSQSHLEQEHVRSMATAEAKRSELERRLMDADAKLMERDELLQHIQDLTATISKLELDLKSAVEEKCQLANEMPVLQVVHGEMRKLESAVEQLTSEIQELSTKKNNLEELREVLESAKSVAEKEAKRLRRDVESKNQDIARLSAQIEAASVQLEQGQLEKKELQNRIGELESTISVLQTNVGDSSETIQNLEKKLLDQSTALKRVGNDLDAEKEQSARSTAELTKIVSDLKRSSDETRHQFETTIANLERQLEIEQQAVVLAKKESADKSKSLKQQISDMEVVIENLIKSETSLKSENDELESRLNSSQLQFEQDREDMAKGLEMAEQEVQQLKNRLESVTSSQSLLAKECEQLKADKDDALQDKGNLEQLQARLSEVEQRLELVEKEKEALGERMACLVAEKEDLVGRQSLYEKEIGDLKGELAAERSKVLHGKGEIALEHRKEKAALEARLLVAQTQMKSMQEKMINMTVANNSQAPLEHKINMLTSELEAANKAKSELERQLAQSNLKEDLPKQPVVKQESVFDYRSGKADDDDSEMTVLRKKYDNAKKALVHKDDVITQYALKFEKMQTQLDAMNNEVASVNVDKKKLAIENRSLKTEQQHLLAQLSAEKDKAKARATKHTMALSRVHSGSEGGTLADAMMDARRRSLRQTRSEVVSTSTHKRQQPAGEVFRPPSLAFGDGSDANSIFKVPPSRRDSTSSVCSNRSDISITSRGMNVPQGAGRLFTCDDEDGELFSSSYLNEMKEGKCRVEDSSNRVSELHRRNTMQPPHMRSAYPAEMNDERLRQNDMAIYDQPMATSSRAENYNDNSLHQLSMATSMLSMNTPPAMNTRKRRSSSWAQNDMETPVMVPRKRRSYELDLSECDSTETPSLSSSAERKKHRDASQTLYQRPGPPTPAKNTAKENLSTPSIGSSPPRLVSKNSTKPGSKRSSPTAKSSKLTPASLVRRVHEKFRGNRPTSNENTPSSTRTTPRGSKLNIFRKPLGSRSSNNISDAKP